MSLWGSVGLSTSQWKIEPNLEKENNNKISQKNTAHV